MSIILLEGGNATGKSSLQEALIAGLSDYRACYSLDPSFESLRPLAYRQWQDFASFQFYLAGNMQTLSQLSVNDKVLVDRSPYSTFAMYMARLPESQWSTLLPLFDLIIEQMPQISGVIHLTATKATRLQRIAFKTEAAQSEDLKEIDFEDKKQRAREYLFAHSQAHICTIETSALSLDDVAEQALGFIQQMKTPQLTLLLGLPGAGKSTYCQQLPPEMQQALLLATDELREQHHGTAFNEVIREQVMVQLLKQTMQALKQGRSVIVDTTFMNTKSARARLFECLAAAKLNYQLKIKHFDIDLETCIARDQQRPEARRVGSQKIEQLAASFELFQPQEVELIKS